MPKPNLPPGRVPPVLPGATQWPPSPKDQRPIKPLSLRERMPWLPWVLPFALFLVLTGLEGQFTQVYPIFYTVKMALIVVVLVRLRKFLPEAKPRRDGVGLAIVFGIALFVLWLVVDFITPHFPALFGNRIGYNPFQEIANPVLRVLFLLVRFFGLIVIAPICEELFYRGFLLRFVTDMDDFRRVPIGRFNSTAFAAVVVLMAVSHPEWLAAAVFSAAMCALLARTRNLFACFVAHGVTNGLLGIYVLLFHDWRYW